MNLLFLHEAYNGSRSLIIEASGMIACKTSYCHGLKKHATLVMFSNGDKYWVDESVDEVQAQYTENLRIELNRPHKPSLLTFMGDYGSEAGTVIFVNPLDVAEIVSPLIPQESDGEFHSLVKMRNGAEYRVIGNWIEIDKALKS